MFLKPKILGEFHNYEYYCSKAPTHLSRDSICVDSKGRRCKIGADFMRARDEDAFPVYHFKDFEEIEK